MTDDLELLITINKQRSSKNPNQHADLSIIITFIIHDKSYSRIKLFKQLTNIKINYFTKTLIHKTSHLY